MWGAADCSSKIQKLWVLRHLAPRISAEGLQNFDDSIYKVPGAFLLLTHLMLQQPKRWLLLPSSPCYGWEAFQGTGETTGPQLHCQQTAEPGCQPRPPSPSLSRTRSQFSLNLVCLHYCGQLDMHRFSSISNMAHVFPWTLPETA